MIIYSKYLEDNIEGIYNRDMDEYRKYVKLFYSENSRCPADQKTVLEKEENSEQIRLWCKMRNGKMWNALISKPLIMNLNLKLDELSKNYNNKCLLFKNQLRTNLNSIIYNPEKDKEIEKKLIDLKNEENQLESLKDVFKKERDIIDDIIKKRENILKNLLEIRIKKNNSFKKCILITGEVKRKIMEITKNEKEITTTRLEQIAKNISMKPEEVKNWIEYFRLIIDYLKENAILDELNKKMFDLKYKFEKINSFYIINPPVIEISEGTKKSLEKSIIKQLDKPVEDVVKEALEETKEEYEEEIKKKEEEKETEEVLEDLMEKEGNIAKEELKEEEKLEKDILKKVKAKVKTSRVKEESKKNTIKKNEKIKKKVVMKLKKNKSK